MNIESKRFNSEIVFESIESKGGYPVLFSVFGSFMYGLNTPNSDLDYKGIYLPSFKSRLFKEKNIHFSTAGDNERNSPDDIDCEIYSLEEFASLALEGQTVAVDLLFSDDEHNIETTKEWRKIKKNRNLFLSKRISSFIGYARNQARKYGIKGSRLGTLNKIIEMKNVPGMERRTVGDCVKNILEIDSVTRGEGEKKFVSLFKKQNFHLKNGESAENDLSYLEIAGKKFPLTRKMSELFDSLSKVRERYGSRSLDAMNDDGVDWKALSHAFRALFQADKLAESGTFSYPLPESEFLLDVKTGRKSYAEISETLEKKMEETMIKIKKSKFLPEEPDENVYSLLESVEMSAMLSRRDKNMMKFDR